uniref:B-cell antigen receptor complex-associated protein beta chain n=1 Tax=Pelusios castaneus TaxID=367368 RepID=A0A8C8STK8_9SAUR
PWTSPRSTWPLEVNLVEKLIRCSVINVFPGFVSSGTFCSHFHQQPRYVAAKKNTEVHFICHSRNSEEVQWYKITDQDKKPQLIDKTNPRVSEERNKSYVTISIRKIRAEDNGIYLCENKNLVHALEQIHTCGSELRVIGDQLNLQQAQSRNTVKDIIIMIQSILLVIFMSIPMLFLLEKGDGKDSSEEDHTYEGLEIEQTATYEDIAPLRDVKAKWTVGEHPGHE